MMIRAGCWVSVLWHRPLAHLRMPPRFVLFDVFSSSDTLTIGAPSQPPLDARIARELAGILTHWSAMVLLDSEISPLRNIRGVEKISASDPRLGHLFRKVGLGAATVQEFVDRVTKRSHALPSPDVAVRLRRLREAVQAKERMTLEEELRDIGSEPDSHSERNRLYRGTVSWLGRPRGSHPAGCG